MHFSDQRFSFQVDTLAKMDEEKALPLAHNISIVNGAGCFFHSILLLIQCLDFIVCHCRVQYWAYIDCMFNF